MENMLHLYDYLDNIDTASGKARLALEILMEDYFSGEPTDTANILLNTGTIAKLLDIAFDYVCQIEGQYTKAKGFMERILEENRQANKQPEHQDAEPRTDEEAIERIRNIDLSEHCTEIDNRFRRTIKEYVMRDSGKESFDWLIDWAIAIAYNIGKQEGKRMQRQHQSQQS